MYKNTDQNQKFISDSNRLKEPIHNAPGTMESYLEELKRKGKYFGYPDCCTEQFLEDVIIKREFLDSFISE
jgi:hypothetical protein